MLLADYGADVVKVESPRGREFRLPGAASDSYFFLSSNRGKRTIQRLLGSARTGQPGPGFDLYTQSHLERFRASHGLDPVSFEAMLKMQREGNGPTIGIESIAEVVMGTESVIELTVNYVQSRESELPAERYRLVRDARGSWLIDDIRPIQ